MSDRRSGTKSLVLSGHPVLINNRECLPEDLCLEDSAIYKREDNIQGHIYTLCTQRRTFVKAGKNFAIATWSTCAFDNFIANDPVGCNLGSFEYY